jgi:phosphate starvation-inducible PhoH-like protein
MSNRRRKSKLEDEIFNEIMESNNVVKKVDNFNKFKPKNKSQSDYIKLIKDYEISICSGPAGTGKSFCAIATAIELILDKTTPYKKLIITTPAVEADEKIGYLPGSVIEKISPYMESSFYLVDKIIGKEMREKLTSQNIIVIEALGLIRGRTFENCIVFLEEAQNTTPRQMKTFLTRIGENAKFIISGDIEQSDKFKSGKQSGLFDAMTRLRVIEEIGFHDFMSYDIVRNPIITKILDEYNMKEYNEEPVKQEKILLTESNIIPKTPVSKEKKENIFKRGVKYLLK